MRPMHEYFNGYKTQCDLCGRKTWYEQEQQCHIGKSTGWAPIWLAILKKNSSGGSGLMPEKITDIKPLSVYRV